VTGNVGASRIRRRVVVRGRVQGVFFRAATRERAREVGAAGWVRNLPDGSVEAVFEGEPDAVRAMLEFCRTGPRHARVDALDEREEPPEGLDRFEVR
jgi:acylphosphatase